MSSTNQKGDEQYDSPASSFLMSDIEMSESDSHASQQGNSQGPDLSEWDQLMNNLTTQLENSFYITDDPFVLLSEPRDHEHREPRQQLSSEENSDISLDSSPGTPGQNHFQQPHPYPLSSPDISPRSFKPITLTLTLGLPSGSGLVGILKKHREKKPSKRVKFAPTPSKIVKAYRSGQEQLDMDFRRGHKNRDEPALRATGRKTRRHPRDIGHDRA